MAADLHPSFLELDRLALDVGGPEWRAHVAQCPACSAYLLRQRRPMPVPPWVSRAGGRARLPRWLFPASAVATAAAAALLVTVPALMRPARTAEKGAPSVALYVKRGEVVTLWDGRAALAPGDRVQLETRPEGLRHVAVALRGPAGSWELLYQGLVVRPSDRVPESWRLDDAPGPELLGVVFSGRALSEVEIGEALDREERTSGTWATVLTLRKTNGGGHR